MRLPGLVVIIAILLSACGSDSSSPTTPSVRVPVAASPAASSPVEPSSPTTHSTTPATASPAQPSPSPDLLRWAPIGAIEGHAGIDTDIGAVGFSRGYVSVADASRRPQIWFSANGASWQNVRLPLRADEQAMVYGIASGGDGVVAVGTVGRCRRLLTDEWLAECEARPISWSTSDGLRWHRSAALPASAASTFTAVWHVAGTGWEAAQAFATGVDLPLVGPALWRSKDGLRWTLLVARPKKPRNQESAAGVAYHSAVMFRAAADASRRRVSSQAGTGCDGDRYVLSTSRDGRRYRILDAFPGGCDEWMVAMLPSDGTGPWLFGGGRFDNDTGAEIPLVWASRDLRSWTTVVLEAGDAADGSVSQLARFAGGYVATGAAGDGAATWLSADGSTWVRATGAGGPVVLADGPAGLIGLAEQDDGRIGVYRLEAKE